MDFDRIYIEDFMRYILYLFTMVLLFVAGMMVGNMYLPEQAASLAAAVSVPALSDQNPAMQTLTRETTEKNLTILNDALHSCPAVVNEEKDRILNEIRLRLAVEDFELKKARLELEIAKNKEVNRPTAQFTQANVEYNQARAYAEKLANELFPIEPAKEETTPSETSAGQVAPAQEVEQQKIPSAKPAKEILTK
jgi:hypothetical protein